MIEYPTLALLRCAEGRIRIEGENDPTQLAQTTETGEACPEGIGIFDPIPLSKTVVGHDDQS